MPDDSSPPPISPEEEPPPTDLDEELPLLGQVPHGGASAPATAGWGQDEPPPSALDDAGPHTASSTGDPPPLPDESQLDDPPSNEADTDEMDPLSPDLGDEDAIWPLDQDPVSEDWEDPSQGDLPAVGRHAAPDWSDLEEEARTLPTGRDLVGRLESVRLAGWTLPPLDARMDTGAAASSLHAELRGSDEDHVRVCVSGQELNLPRAEVHAPRGQPEDAVWVRVTLRLAGTTLPVRLRIRPPSDAEVLVLGCDVLAGRFVVDAAARHLHGRP